MNSRYKSDFGVKIRQNQSLIRYLKSILSPENVNALVIDTASGYTTRELVKIGVKRITVVNYDENELLILKEKYPIIKMFSGSFEEFCLQTEETFNFIYYDSCNTLHTSYKAIFHLFNKKILCQNKNVLALSMSSRQRVFCDPDKLKEPYRIKEWRHYVKSDNWASYYSDQLVRDYALRNKYLLQRKNRKGQYKSSMFQLVYYQR